MSHTTRSAVANIVTGVALFVATSVLAWYALNVASEPRGMDELGLPACVTEDQVAPDCYWDATEHGNGQGMSFIVVNGTVTYEDGSTTPAE